MTKYEYLIKGLSFWYLKLVNWSFVCERIVFYGKKYNLISGRIQCKNKLKFFSDAAVTLPDNGRT